MNHPPNTTEVLSAEIINSDIVNRSDGNSSGFNTVNRKVINSDIIEKRINKRNANNPWDYVAKINADLTSLPIREDNSIQIVLDFDISPYIESQIIEIFGSEGWDITISVSGVPVGDFPGRTELNFLPM